MLCAEWIEERSNPILHDHCILRSACVSQRQAVLEPFASPTSHSHPNSTSRLALLFHGMLDHLYRSVG
jgi:hypothetical protein